MREGGRRGKPGLHSLWRLLVQVTYDTDNLHSTQVVTEEGDACRAMLHTEDLIEFHVYVMIGNK